MQILFRYRRYFSGDKRIPSAHGLHLMRVEELINNLLITIIIQCWMLLTLLKVLNHKINLTCLNVANRKCATMCLFCFTTITYSQKYRSQIIININNSSYIKLILRNTRSLSLAKLITTSSGFLYNSLQIQSKSQTSPTNSFFSQNVNKLFYVPSGRDQSGLSTTYSPS